MKGRPWAWALGFCNCGKSSDSCTVEPALQPWTNLQLSHVLAMMFLSQSDSESWGLRTVHVHPGEGSSPTTKEHLSIVCEVGCPIQGFTSQQQTEPNKTRGYFVHVLDRYNSPLLLFAKNRGFPWHRTCCLKKKNQEKSLANQDWLVTQLKQKLVALLYACNNNNNKNVDNVWLRHAQPKIFDLRKYKTIYKAENRTWGLGF